DEAAKELVAQAKAHGGHDNITVVIVDVEDDGTTPVSIAAKTQRPKKSRAPKVPSAPKGARITLRVILFVALALALIGVGVGSVLWYARASYYVGVQGDQLTIYRGRPEPVLWFKPTVAERTSVNV